LKKIFKIKKMSALKIYKASAGSGKTYRLTEDYLKLIFKNPNMKIYKKILATTFTNKAAEEMKTRILKEIFNLSKGEKNGHFDIIKNKFGYSPEEIKLFSKNILTQILHNYSHFSISTIDKFFQKIIRSFAKDLKLSSSFEIELNSNEILKRATENLLKNISENKDLEIWITNFAKDKIRNGKTWNLKNDINELAKEIFKENFLSLDEEKLKVLKDKNLLRNYQKKVKKFKDNFEKKQKEIGEKALKIIENNNLKLTDFKYGKSSFANIFKKISYKNFDINKRAIDAQNDISVWRTEKSKKKKSIEKAYQDGVNELLIKSISIYEEDFEKYNSADIILKFFYTLGILTDIRKSVQEYNDKKNIFPIAYSSRLLNEIIDDEETPFIYEKIGNSYDHFMIDEFQDTSKLQYKNFFPLINNSMAFKNENLIVGDIKQSIYRWRNSDWTLLANNIEKDFSHFNENIEFKSLKYNWRSKKNLVDFNNSLFFYASEILEKYFSVDLDGDFSDLKGQIKSAYSTIFQKMPKKNNGGFVELSFLEYDKKKEEIEDKVKENLINSINNLLENNYQKKDICVLVRYAKDGKKVANYLLESNFNVISNDSLFIKNSYVVNFLIGILNYFNDSKDELNKVYINYIYEIYIKNNSKNLDEIFSYNEEDFDKFFDLKDLKILPIFDIIEHLIKIFSLSEIKKELVYLQAFQDIVLNFSQKEGVDINLFLFWWNETGNEKTIDISENSDAIKIMTIHKSKGLEFKAVILPYCDWKIDHNPLLTNILWCELEGEFSGLPLIPVKYSSNLKKSIFKKEYFNEQLQTYVDNLNLLYVAFTRARNSLFAFLPIKINKTKNLKISDIPTVLKNVINGNNEINNKFINLKEFYFEEEKKLKIGKLSDFNEKVSDEKDEKFYLENYFTSFSQKSLRLKKKAKNFFKEFGDKKNKNLEEGNLMHQIFEDIKTLKDIPFAVRKKVFEGKISEKERKILEKNILNVIKKAKLENWFSDKWEVKNEIPILEKGKKVKIPDRVLIKNQDAIIIDYKFGMKKEKYYEFQIRNYMFLLKKMGFKNVKSYLWYVNLEEIQEVFF